MARDRKLFDSLRESGERHRRRMEAIRRGRLLNLNPPPERRPRRSGVRSVSVSWPWDGNPPDLFDMSEEAVSRRLGVSPAILSLGEQMRAGGREVAAFRSSLTEFAREVQGAWEDIAINGGLVNDIMCRYVSPAAEEKARALLLSLLTPSQRAQYARGFIEVRGQLTGRTYRICTASTMYNITASGPRGEALKLCAAPSGRLPKADKLLGQVMGLQCDERRFLRAANIIPAGFGAGELAHALCRFASGEEFSLPPSTPQTRVPITFDPRPPPRWVRVSFNITDSLV